MGKVGEQFASQESRQITGKLRGMSLKRWEDLKWILREDHNMSNGSERPASDAKVMDYLINNFFDTL